MEDRPRDREALRRALRRAYPWLDDRDRGPRAVVAGECDRCGEAPRVLPTCGPVPWQALCATCGLQVGFAGWCDGHRPDARGHLRWAAALPEEWPLVVRLWWVATGEVRLDVLVVPPGLRRRLPVAVRAELAPGGPTGPDGPPA